MVPSHPRNRWMVACLLAWSVLVSYLLSDAVVRISQWFSKFSGALTLKMFVLFIFFAGVCVYLCVLFSPLCRT